jgi:hypothetical protein
MNTAVTSMIKSRRGAANSQMVQPGFFADPSLFPGEDASGYKELLAAVTEAMKPRDILETIQVRTVVNSQWDVMRYERIRAYYVQERLKNFSEFEYKPNIIASPEDKLANVFVKSLKSFEGFNRMVMMGEARRNAAYRQMERHRSGSGARADAAEIEDAEFHEVENEHDEQKRGA